MTDSELARTIVETADRLFYGCGIAQVGMDRIRDEAGVSLKSIYKHFPSKEALVLGVLDLRHRMWEEGLRAEADSAGSPEAQLLAVYDYLAHWFTDDSFRGCGFINAFGELGAANPTIAAAVRAHKASFQAYVDALVSEAGYPKELGPQLALLAEGAQSTAAISGDPATAMVARRAAQRLISAY